MSTDSPTPAATDNTHSEKPWWIAAILAVVAAGLIGWIVGANYSWMSDDGTVVSLAKFGIWLLLIVACLCIGVAGVVRITASNKDTAETTGCVMLGFAFLAAGLLLSLRLHTVDDFASFKYLVEPHAEKGSAGPDLELEPVDWGKGIVQFKVPKRYLWIAVNVDYVEGHGFPPRTSDVLYYVEAGNEVEVTVDGKTEKFSKTGYFTFKIPTNSLPYAKRVGVFSGTGDAPGGESSDLNPAHLTKEADESASDT